MQMFQDPKMIMMVASNSTESNSSYDDDDVCNSLMLEEDSLDIIWGPMHTTYQILFPIFITIGIIINLASLSILRRTNYQEYPINRYLLVISVINIVYNMFLIPISITNNGCMLNSSSAATYYAHFGWALPECMTMARNYIVMSIAYDRFLVNYFPYYFYFKNINDSNIIRKRMIGIVLFSIIVTIPFSYCASAKTCISDSSIIYIVNDFYRSANFIQSLVKIVSFWIPIIFIIILNTFVVVAIIQRKIEKPLQVVSGAIKNYKFYLTNSSLVITNMIYLLFQIPIFLYISNASSTMLSEGICHNSYGVEIFRAVGNVTEWLLCVLHLVPILILNEEFKHTLLNRLCKYKTYIISCRKYCSQFMNNNLAETNSADTKGILDKV
ncbi:unnamed protein product [Meganyctiphanes norvegica]|uniref:G-protein coupled receptors family 1 profile domain-containing protein n=1 Tax=Meganyctiphanes norvegica TaxID=48144 RepID=A0AAV2SII2_MEGNR